MSCDHGRQFSVVRHCWARPEKAARETTLKSARGKPACEWHLFWSLHAQQASPAHKRTTRGKEREGEMGEESDRLRAPLERAAVDQLMTAKSSRKRCWNAVCRVTSEGSASTQRWRRTLSCSETGGMYANLSLTSGKVSMLFVRDIGLLRA